MAPRFHTGDLAVVRKAGHYGVGDVVAYRSAVLDTMVLHRIVAVTDGRFDTKGDNNSFIDIDHPSADEITGKLWVRAPEGGRVLAVASASMVPGGAGVLLLGGRRRRTRRGLKVRADHLPVTTLDVPARTWRTVTITCVVVAVATTLLSVVTFTRPALTAATGQADYAQSGSFTYATPVPSDAVYQGGQLRTGDPVFLAILHALDVTFDYRIDGFTPAPTGGDIAMTATIAASNGWQRSIELVAPRQFTGDRTSVVGRLDLAAVRAQIAQAELITGYRGAYTVSVTPRVTTTGSGSGEPGADAFAPALTFDLDAIQLRLTGSPDPASAPIAQLQPRQEGSRNQMSIRSARLGVGGLELPLGALRVLALVLALASTGATMACLRAGSRRLGREGSRIALRHGHRLVDIRTMRNVGEDVTDVRSIDDLAHLAEIHGTSILHERNAYGHLYWCEAGSALYRYSVPAVPTAVPGRGRDVM
jgi:hypothetical protein